MLKRLFLVKVAILLLSSCGSKTKLVESEKTSLQSSRYVIVKDSLAAGWNFTGKINIEQLQALDLGEQKTIANTDESGKLMGEITFYKDALGNLQVRCQEKDQIIQNLRREKETVSQQKELVKEEKKVRNTWNWNSYILGAFTILVAIFGVWYFKQLL
jgi:hypothetical protein